MYQLIIILSYCGKMDNMHNLLVIVSNVKLIISLFHFKMQ
jgi:hypothetical protein